MTQKYLIVTSNYPARQRGVAKLMSIREAQQKCPDLVLINGEDLTPYRHVNTAPIFSSDINPTFVVSETSVSRAKVKGERSSASCQTSRKKNMVLLPKEHWGNNPMCSYERYSIRKPKSVRGPAWTNSKAEGGESWGVIHSIGKLWHESVHSRRRGSKRVQSVLQRFGIAEKLGMDEVIVDGRHLYDYIHSC